MLFIWRLNVKKPHLIELGIDTMVMNNDDAKCRHGVKPTYRRKRDFQPLQMNWGRLIREDVPVIIRMDSGFFDQKIFNLCEELGIGYICGGKIYKDISAMAASIDDRMWKKYSSGKKDFWEYAEFGSRRAKWDKFRRAVYCRLTNDDKQLYLPGFRPDTVIITNIGQGQAIDTMLKKAGAKDYLETQNIIACYHERGCDELANRALKDFGHEQMPFKRFNPNAAWYYSMLLGHYCPKTNFFEVSN